MATQLQLRKGNTAQTAVFTGALAEVTVDTDQKTVVVHDGTTVGGTYIITKAQLDSNVSILQGVNTTQNTNITSVNGFAAGAFNTANGANGLAAGAFNLANTNSGLITIIQGVDATQNTNITAVNNYAASAYAQANTNATNITAVNGFAAGAFATANGANGLAQGAFNSANTNTNNIIAVNGLAQGAFDKANTATTTAQNAYNTANTGYNFVTSGGTVTGNVIINGNLDVTGNVTFTGNVTNVTITGNTGQFFGNTITGFDALYAGIPGFDFQPQTVFQVAGDYNGYAQINIENINAGQNASTDYVATADNGNESDTFIDMGINSSTYNNIDFSLQGPNDGYLYVHGNTATGGGNLIVSTIHENDIIFSVNGTRTENEVMRVDATANTLAVKTSVSLNTNSNITTTAITVSGTSETVVDTFPTASYRSAKYFVQMTSLTDHHIIELNILHDGTTVYLAQYGEIFNGISLGTFDATIATGTLSLKFTPVNASTTVKMFRNLIAV